jgi:hypothetical protein
MSLYGRWKLSVAPAVMARREPPDFDRAGPGSVVPVPPSVRRRTVRGKKAHIKKGKHRTARWKAHPIWRGRIRNRAAANCTNEPDMSGVLLL